MYITDDTILKVEKYWARPGDLDHDVPILVETSCGVRPVRITEVQAPMVRMHLNDGATYCIGLNDTIRTQYNWNVSYKEDFYKNKLPYKNPSFVDKHGAFMYVFKKGHELRLKDQLTCSPLEYAEDVTNIHFDLSELTNTGEGMRECDPRLAALYFSCGEFNGKKFIFNHLFNTFSKDCQFIRRYLKSMYPRAKQNSDRKMYPVGVKSKCDIASLELIAALFGTKLQGKEIPEELIFETNKAWKHQFICMLVKSWGASPLVRARATQAHMMTVKNDLALIAYLAGINTFQVLFGNKTLLTKYTSGLTLGTGDEKQHLGRAIMHITYFTTPQPMYKVELENPDEISEVTNHRVELNTRGFWLS